MITKSIPATKQSSMRSNLGKDPSVLHQFPAGFSDAVAAEIEGAILPWRKDAYVGYTSSGYESVSLLNQSGIDTDVIIDDCATTQPTSSLRSIPTLEKFLSDTKLPLMWARLNKLAPGCCFWEHRDYSELEEVDRVRLHLPILTSPSNLLVFSKYAYHLTPDTLWSFDPGAATHGFINGSAERIHLILDCYMNDALSEMLDRASEPEAGRIELPVPPDAAYDKLMSEARSLCRQGDTVAAEELLLKSFFDYSQPTGWAYDMVIKMHSDLDDSDKAEEWSTKKARYLKKENLEVLQHEFSSKEKAHIEGEFQDGDVGQFHKDVHATTYDPDRLESAYDRYAARYDDLLLKLAGDGTSGCSYHTTAFFSRVVPRRRGLHILDAGVGTGIGGKELMELGFEEMHLEGADLSSGMLEQAHKRGIYSELHHMRFPDEDQHLAPDSFDAVLCAGSFSHGAMPATAMADFARVTKTGGIVVFSIRKSVYEEPGSEMKAMVDHLVASNVWEVLLEEVGEYLPADEVKAVYFGCRIK